MPDITQMGMTKEEIKKEAEEIHYKNVEEIENTLPPEVSKTFLKAYDAFVERCYEEHYVEDDDDDELFTEHFTTFMNVITQRKKDIMKEWNEANASGD